MEPGPFSPVNAGYAQDTDKAGGYRGEGIHKASSQLEGQHSHLAGNTDQVGQGSHDGHGQGGLPGVGGDNQVKAALEQVHKLCTDEGGDAVKDCADSIEDGV